MINVKWLEGLRMVARSFRKDICMCVLSSIMFACHAKPGCFSIKKESILYPYCFFSSRVMARAILDGPKPIPIRS